MTIISTTVGKNPIEEMNSPHNQQEWKMLYLGTDLKMTEWSRFISKANHFNITVIQVHAPTTDAKEAEVEGSMMIYKTF